MYKVLVIDDDENIRIFIERLLTKKFSCSVITAENGLDGLNRIKYDKPEIVFLDITMPVLDGVETLKRIREDETIKNLPVIMLTAISDKAIIAKVLKMGITSYLLKPLMFDEAYDRIRELFYGLRTQLEEAKKKSPDKDTPQKPIDNFLIIDIDEKFRSSLRQQMEKSAIVLEASNGAEGLQQFVKFWPKTVCIGQNLPFMNEKLLCQKIRQLEKENHKEVTIFAVRDDLNLTQEESKLFDLVVPKKGGFPGL